MTMPDRVPEGGSRYYSLDATDPRGELVDRGGMDEAEVAEIDELMAALVAVRDVERRIAAASRRYMELNDTDMRAVHFIIASEHRGETATPGAIARHLGISTASTTKLLDRLERAGHVRRVPHPRDRRALAIVIAEDTRAAAMSSIGRQQSRRVHAARRLSSEERGVVVRFLRDMAEELERGMEDWAPEE